MVTREPHTEAHKTRISERKRGVPQSLEHREARKRGRRPKFAPGDSVAWFDEVGIVEALVGIASAYGDGRKAYWYTVRFGERTRELVQEVLSLV